MVMMGRLVHFGISIWLISSFEDGGVEGCVLIFSCKKYKTATNHWTAIDKRMLDPTKKRYPTSKGKEEAPTRW